MEKQTINITIGGRSYKFQVAPENEPKVRAAAKKIDAKHCAAGYDPESDLAGKQGRDVRRDATAA